MSSAEPNREIAHLTREIYDLGANHVGLGEDNIASCKIPSNRGQTQLVATGHDHIDALRLLRNEVKKRKQPKNRDKKYRHR